MRFGVSGINCECCLVMIDSIVGLTFLSQQASKVIMRLSITWPQRDGLAIMCYRLITLATLVQSDSQIVMRHPATGVICECRCVQSYEVVVSGTLLPC